MGLYIDVCWLSLLGSHWGIGDEAIGCCRGQLHSGLLAPTPWACLEKKTNILLPSDMSNCRLSILFSTLVSRSGSQFPLHLPITLWKSLSGSLYQPLSHGNSCFLLKSLVILPALPVVLCQYDSFLVLVVICIKGRTYLIPCTSKVRPHTRAATISPLTENVSETILIID